MCYYVIWLGMVFEDQGVQIAGPVVVREVNKAYQMFVDHAGNFSRTICIDVRYHFVRERLERGDIIHLDYMFVQATKWRYLYEGAVTRVV